MNKNQKVLLTVSVLGVFVLIFALTAKLLNTVVTPPLITPAINNISSGLDRFTVDMYKSLSAGNKQKNVFYSPASIMSVLGLASSGAKGETQSQIKKLMYFSVMGDSTINDGFKDFFTIVNRQGKAYELSIANGAWVENTYKLQETFKDVATNSYNANVENKDFKGNAENSRKNINDWVSGKTNNKIQDLFPAGSITSDTRLVLANAVYFKADWKYAFEKKATVKRTFTLSSKATKQVDMMYLRDSDENKLNYSETADMQILELPYKSDEMSMFVILPKNNDIASLEQKIDNQFLTTQLDQLSLQKVQVSLPKFKFSTSYDLIPNLKSLGMTDAFDDVKADFSGIGGSKDLVVSGVFHKAYIDVNEEGTEAAAATGMVFDKVSMPMEPDYKVFNADHPFIFVIKGSGSADKILFMGKVEDPSAL